MRLVDCANAYLPWEQRFRCLLDSGWKCSQQSIALSTTIFWYSPHQKYIYSSWTLATMSAKKFRRLVTRNFIWFSSVGG